MSSYDHKAIGFLLFDCVMASLLLTRGFDFDFAGLWVFSLYFLRGEL